MKVSSDDQIPWAKEMIIMASHRCDLWVFMDQAIENANDDTLVTRYFNGTLTEKEREQLSEYLKEEENYYEIEWTVNGKKVIACPACKDEDYCYMSDFYYLCEEIVINDPKREFTFEAKFENGYSSLYSGTKCDVHNGQFDFRGYKIDPAEIENPDDDIEQMHIVKGQLINGKYEFEVLSEFSEDYY